MHQKPKSQEEYSGLDLLEIMAEMDGSEVDQPLRKSPELGIKNSQLVLLLLFDDSQ